MISFKSVLKQIADNEIKFIDFRFTDTIGQEYHTTLPANTLNEEKLKNGYAFDGSSVPGWKNVEKSDMLLIPDINTAVIDPFYKESTLIMLCNIFDPFKLKDYHRDPRSIARRAESYLRSSGLGDAAYFGPEPEFFVFDSVTWNIDMSNTFFKIKSEEAPWSTAIKMKNGNTGHRPSIGGGYFRVPPTDSFQDMRSEMCLLMEKVGIPVELHHHEVAAPGQLEIGTKFSTLVQRADWTQLMKYIIRNVAHSYGKTATFMPKPIINDNGSGMHVHQSIWKDNRNLFAGNGYAGLSEFALYYIGGIIKHGRALNAITNPCTNSYKRLVPHYEAPVKLSYAACNRSTSVRIPYENNPNSQRIETRFPDSLANPYLAFSALMMAGLDGVQNKIHPGNPTDANLYNLSLEDDSKIPTVCASLEEALTALERDNEFLTRGDVFSHDMLNAFIELKMKDVNNLRMTTHPIEFDMYYGL